MANEFVAKNGLISKSDVIVSGSITASNGLYGTASWAQSSITSSYATTASFALNFNPTATASYATNALSASWSPQPIVPESVASASWASSSISASYAPSISTLSGIDNYIPKWSSNSLTPSSSIYDAGYVSSSVSSSALSVWTFRSSSIITPNNFDDITYGNGLFVAVGGSTTRTSSIITSPDGINWTPRTSSVPVTNQFYGITYGSGTFVAVGVDTPTSSIMTSPDGINWTSRTSSLTTNYLVGITYGSGTFVAVGGLNYNKYSCIITSPNGINWTTQTSSLNTNIWYGITYAITGSTSASGIFVAVGASGGGDKTGSIMTSPDAVTWTSRTSSINGTNVFGDITYASGTFVIVGGGYSDRYSCIMTSPNGINWTTRTSSVAEPNSNYWRGITYASGTFVAVNSGGSSITSSIMTSPDGITWTSKTSSISVGLYAVTYASGTVVAVGHSTNPTKSIITSTTNNVLDYTTVIKIGINTNIPSASLHVNGNILATSITASLQGSSSYALSASYVPDLYPQTLQVSASWASSSLSSSYAKSASYSPVEPSYSASVSLIKQNTLTNTLYTITASLATSASYYPAFPIIDNVLSASWASASISASYAPFTIPTSVASSSWASSSISSSYALSASWSPQPIVPESVASASWASSSISASYVSQSVKGTGITDIVLISQTDYEALSTQSLSTLYIISGSGALDPSTSSYSYTAISASYALSASWSPQPTVPDSVASASWASSSISSSYAISASYAPGGSSLSGTDNYIPKWSSNTLTTSSNLFDNGTNVGINTTSSTALLNLKSLPVEFLTDDGWTIDYDWTGSRSFGWVHIINGVTGSVYNNKPAVIGTQYVVSYVLTGDFVQYWFSFGGTEVSNIMNTGTTTLTATTTGSLVISTKPGFPQWTGGTMSLSISPSVGDPFFSLRDKNEVSKLTIDGGGNVIANGYVSASSFTGSLFGTSSLAISASYAPSAGLTARYINNTPFDGTANINLASLDWTPVFYSGITYGNDVSTFIRTTGTPAWDASVQSTESYTKNVYCSFKVTSNNTQSLYAGLSDNPTAHTLAAINYAFRLSSDSSATIYEANSLAANLANYTTNSVCAIRYDGANVKYYYDGNLVRTTARAVGTDLHFNAMMYYTGSEGIRDVEFGPIVGNTINGSPTEGMSSIKLSSMDWIPGFSGGATYGSDGTTFIKSSGATAWDGRVYSPMGFTRSVYCSCKSTSTGQGTFWGLGERTATAYSAIDYCFQYGIGGGLEIYELGSNQQSVGTYTINTICEIMYDGVNIRYYKDGAVVRTVARTPGAGLYFDAYMVYPYSTGITGVKFGSLPTSTVSASIAVSASFAISSSYAKTASLCQIIPVVSTAPTGTPLAGTITFDTSSNMLYIYNGAAWKSSSLY
jgi:hypothetical protein